MIQTVPETARRRPELDRSTTTIVDGPLTVSTRRGAMRADGEIDHASAATFAAALAPLIARGGDIRIDLRRVSFMGTAGAHVLDDAARTLGQRGRLVLLDPARPVERVLEILGLQHLMDQPQRRR